jgi:hypothetical protein
MFGSTTRPAIVPVASIIPVEIGPAARATLAFTTATGGAGVGTFGVAMLIGATRAELITRTSIVAVASAAGVVATTAAITTVQVNLAVPETYEYT